MTCKECLHYEACLNILTKSFPNTKQEEIDRVTSREGSCRYFKDNDLINRQKAEIERLEKDRKKNFEMWKKLCEQAEEKHEKMFQEAKATIRPKAIKEFAERVDSMFAKIENELPKNKIVKATIQVYKDMLQIVKKEMVGENND